MFRKSLFLACMAVLALGVTARADEFTTNITLTNAATGFGTTAGVTSISGSQSAGFSYTTTTSTAPGSAVAAVNADLLSQASFLSGVPQNLRGDNLVVVGAEFGTQNKALPGQLSATFTSGVIQVYDQGPGKSTFDPKNPTTWQKGTLVYSSSLQNPPGSVFPGLGAATFGIGPGFPIAQPASSQNTFFANLNTPFNSQGNGIVNTTFNDNSIFQTPMKFDGFQVNVNETLVQKAGNGLDGGATNADLDAVFNSLLGGSLDPFQTFQGGFNPSGPPGFTNGQTVQTFGLTAYPIQTPFIPPPPGVPEPTSMLVWAGIAALSACITGCAGAMRKRRNVSAQ